MFRRGTRGGMQKLSKQGKWYYMAQTKSKKQTYKRLPKLDGSLIHKQKAKSSDNWISDETMEQSSVLEMKDLQSIFSKEVDMWLSKCKNPTEEQILAFKKCSFRTWIYMMYRYPEIDWMIERWSLLAASLLVSWKSLAMDVSDCVQDWEMLEMYDETENIIRYEHKILKDLDWVVCNSELFK